MCTSLGMYCVMPTLLYTLKYQPSTDNKDSYQDLTRNSHLHSHGSQVSRYITSRGGLSHRDGSKYTAPLNFFSDSKVANIKCQLSDYK